MKKRIKSTLLFLSVLLLGFGNVSAVTFTVHQNLVNLSPVPNCNSSNLVTYNDQGWGNVVSMQVEVNHNVNGTVVGSPWLVNTINDHCWRYVKFHIYSVTNGVPSLNPEATVTKYAHWLTGAVYNNGSSVRQYHLTVGDLAGAGLSAGKKQVRIEVKYHYWGNTPHTINLNVSQNNIPSWSQPNIDGANSTLICNMSGIAGCFNYQPCNANVSMIGMAVFYPWPSKCSVIYRYWANVSGGSGNYSYYWSRSNSSQHSTTNQLRFCKPSSPGTVYLTVTDNVTGCVYYKSQSFSKQEELVVATQSLLDVTIAPNPVQASSPLNVELKLPLADVVDLDLYDLNGRKVRSLAHHINGAKGTNNFNLSVEGLVSGIYFVRLTSPKNGPFTRKVVIVD